MDNTAYYYKAFITNNREKEEEGNIFDLVDMYDKKGSWWRKHTQK